MRRRRHPAANYTSWNFQDGQDLFRDRQFLGIPMVFIALRRYDDSIGAAELCEGRDFLGGQSLKDKRIAVNPNPTELTSHPINFRLCIANRCGSSSLQRTPAEDRPKARWSYYVNKENPGASLSGLPYGME